MTDTAGPFDGSPWSEVQWYRFAALWVPSGVASIPATSSSTGDLPLSVSGLSVGIGAGRAWVRGGGFERTGAAVMQTVAANTHASFSRQDRIVLRRNLATHTITPVLLTGTPAGSPTAPTLTQSETGAWDLPMFSFLVPPNSGTTLSGIVDERIWLGTGDARTTTPVTTRVATRPGGGSGNNVLPGVTQTYGSSTAGEVVLPARLWERDVDVSVGFDLYCPSAAATAGSVQLYANGVALGVPGTWSNRVSTTGFAARPVMAQARWAGVLPAAVQNIWVQITTDANPTGGYWVLAYDLTVIER